jgi:hypothetical protein
LALPRDRTSKLVNRKYVSRRPFSSSAHFESNCCCPLRFSSLSLTPPAQ